MAERFYDGMPGPEIRRELNEVYDFMADSMVAPTSSTSLTVGTGEKTLTIEADKALGIGQSVRIARTSDPLTWMDGVVTSYAGTTLKVLVSDSNGSGTYSGWTVTQAGATGPQGEEGPEGPEGPRGPAGPANKLSIGTVVEGEDADATITGDAPDQTLNLTLPKGDKGSKGDKGNKGDPGPANTLAIGTVTGGDTADASITGEAPAQMLNLTLPKGDRGDAGSDGWTPVWQSESDGERRVIRIDDWTGGTGTKPPTGYLGDSGIVADIADATDFRGAPGSGSVSTVNDKDPDGAGNVDIGIDDIPGLDDALADAGKVKTVAGQSPDAQGDVALGVPDIGGLDDALGDKVDKEAGKGLSERSFTQAEKDKLAGLESSRYKGLFSSLSALEAGVVNPQAGDYADVDPGAGADVVRYIWDASDSKWVMQSGEVAPITAAQVKSLYESNPDTNAYSDSEKSKLAGVASGATNTAAPVNADWNAASGLAEIKNKPTIPAIPEKMPLNEATTGSATAQRTIDASVLKAAVLAHAGSSQVHYQAFTLSGTWTKPAGISFVFVEIWGGGGSGSSASGNFGAGGGGGGAYACYLIRASSLPASVSVTVGDGGASVTESLNGNHGGDSFFHSSYRAAGGRRGGRVGGGKGGGGEKGGLYFSLSAAQTSSYFRDILSGDGGYSSGGGGVYNEGYAGAGGGSVMGGAGGSSAGPKDSGDDRASVSSAISTYGGNGGVQQTNGTLNAASVPGGGGAGTWTRAAATPSGAGARGEVRITAW